MRLEDKETELNNLAINLFTEYPVDLYPQYPWVLVRVLPREQRLASGLWIPDNKSVNKPIHEAIVLRTWESKHNKVCPVKMGDHVVYPHFSGYPAWGIYNDEEGKTYRLVVSSFKGDHPPILGILHYSQKSVEEELSSIVVDGIMARVLLQNFDIVRKQKYSVTESGASVPS